MNHLAVTYEQASNFLAAAIARVEPTQVVLDIGSGILPMNYFRPCLHILLEPHREYVEILNHRYAQDPSMLVLAGTAQELLPRFAPAGVDSVFLLDVLEHFSQEDGRAVLAQAERIARRQVVVFTPLGFMPQHAEPGEPDGWGLSGTQWQEHLSGWLPEDLGPGWEFLLCPDFHHLDFRGQELAEPHGAMFAVKNLAPRELPPPARLVELRRPLPSELALERAQGELAQVRAQLTEHQGELAQCRAQLAEARRILDHPLLRLPLRAWRALRPRR